MVTSVPDQFKISLFSQLTHFRNIDFKIIANQNEIDSDFYRQPTKLWAGNVFIRVCPSVGQSVHGGTHGTIAHDALDLTVQGPPTALPLQI